MPIVEYRENKTRSEEGILPSFRISKHTSVRRQNISPNFLRLGRQTRHLHLSSSFRPLPRALLMCFHVICPVLRASAVSSVHTRRCSHCCVRRTQRASEAATACAGERPPIHVLVVPHSFTSRIASLYRSTGARSTCVGRQTGEKMGAQRSMCSMLPESRRHGQGQWPRRTARMSWEHALAWACRLAAGAIDRRGERQP